MTQPCPPIEKIFDIGPCPEENELPLYSVLYFGNEVFWSPEDCDLVEPEVVEMLAPYMHERIVDVPDTPEEL